MKPNTKQTPLDEAIAFFEQSLKDAEQSFQHTGYTDPYAINAGKVLDALRASEQRVVELEKDKERLDFCESGLPNLHAHYVGEGLTKGWWLLGSGITKPFKTLRQAIDAAIAKSKEAKI